MPCPCFHSSSIRSTQSIRKTQNTQTFPGHLTVSVLIHSVVLNLLPLGDVGTRHAESAYALLSDTACRVPTMLLLLTLSILLMLGIIQTSLTLLSLTRKIRLLADFRFPFSPFRLYHTPSASLVPLSQRDKVECGLLL